MMRRVLGMIRERLTRPDAAKGFILDGFPRNIPQAEALSKVLAEMGTPLQAVVLAEPRFGILFKRLAGRRICESCGRVFNVYTAAPAALEHCDKCGAEHRLIQRPDDKEEVIGKRLDVLRGADQAADQLLQDGRIAAGRGRRCRRERGVREYSEGDRRGTLAPWRLADGLEQPGSDLMPAPIL